METEGKERNSTEDLSVSSRCTVNGREDDPFSGPSESEGGESVGDEESTNGRTASVEKGEEERLKLVGDSPANRNGGVVSLSEYHQLREETDRLMEELAAEKKKLDNQCKELMRKLDTVQHQLAGEKERADAADSNLKKKLEQLIDTESEKDALMSRLTVLDQEKIRLLDEQVTMERKWRENIKECEKLQAQVKSQRSEINRLTASIEKTESHLTEQTKELVKLREEVGSLNIKVKWAQNKLKSETEAHKESKTQLTATNKKLNQAKEEGEQIRADLKTMIKQYQESEEMRSNSLDVQLRKKKEELQNQEQEIADQQQLHTLTVKELEISKASLELAQRECQQLKTKVSELTTQITEKQEELDELRLSLDKQKDEGKKLESEITVMADMNKDIESERRSHSALRESYSHLQKTSQQLEKELGRRKEKEAELLAFSEKLSSSNAELQAEKTSLESQLSSLHHETQSLSTLLSDSQTATHAQELELKELRGLSQEKISLLMQQLTDKTMAVEQLTLTLEEEREEAVALRRKHASNIKDMQRQIQLYIKRIEQLESSNDDEVATLPVSHSRGMGMRSISHGSLDGTTAIAALHAPPLLRAASPDVEAVTSRTHLLQAPGSPPSDSSNTMHPVSGSSSSGELFHTLDHEKTLLVEKLCQLKRQLARREEKIEFYDGHSHQLTEDIQRKSKIIQSYIMREHSGVLAPPEADAHKMKLSRKHGIMASMFSGDVTKAHTDMTLELSLEINRKMQAVLEDTLLKNITLKESIDTLGQEISRLTTQLKSLQKSPSSR